MFFFMIGGGKIEILFFLMLNLFCYVWGFIMMDGKVQNDMVRIIWYLVLCFGCEDDVEFINYMIGGCFCSELFYVGDKFLLEFNFFNFFVYVMEILVIEMFQLMLFQNVQGGEWQFCVIVMNKVLVLGVKYLCVVEKRCMLMQLLCEYMFLEKMVVFYVIGVDICWLEEVFFFLKNYLQELFGFDMVYVRILVMWIEELCKQYGYCELFSELDIKSVVVFFNIVFCFFRW